MSGIFAFKLLAVLWKADESWPNCSVKRSRAGNLRVLDFDGEHVATIDLGTCALIEAEPLSRSRTPG